MPFRVYITSRYDAPTTQNRPSIETGAPTTDAHSAQRHAEGSADHDARRKERRDARPGNGDNGRDQGKKKGNGQSSKWLIFNHFISFNQIVQSL